MIPYISDVSQGGFEVDINDEHCGDCSALTAEDDPESPSEDVSDLAADCAEVVLTKVDSAIEVPEALKGGKFNKVNHDQSL